MPNHPPLQHDGGSHPHFQQQHSQNKDLHLVGENRNANDNAAGHADSNGPKAEDFFKAFEGFSGNGDIPQTGTQENFPAFDFDVSRISPLFERTFQVFVGELCADSSYSGDQPILEEKIKIGEDCLILRCLSMPRDNEHESIERLYRKEQGVEDGEKKRAREKKRFVEGWRPETEFS